MKSTKKALLSSILSILLCVALLAGATFAWFTDTVASGMNKIVAGNLDIELEYSKNGTDWATVEGTTDLFDDVALWEPGATSVVYLKIVNKGAVALKYNLAVTAIGGDFTNVAGEKKNLKDALKFVQVAGDNLTEYATREEAVAAAESVAFGLSDYSQADTMAAEDVSYVTLILTMPTTVGNEFNYKTGAAAPKIELGITLNATQYTAESDSFDEFYDVASPYLGEVDEVPAEEDGVITVMTAGQLAGLAKAVNSGTSFAGKTVMLGNDIDFNGVTILSIGSEGTGSFDGIFDGNGKTVKNANIVSPSQSGVGFIGYIGSGVLKNLTLENVNSKGVEHVGVLVGYTATGGGTVTNCTVKNCSAIGIMRDASDDSANAVGGIIGHVAQGGGRICLTNNTIDGLTVTGYRKLGALVGCLQSGSQASVDIEGNSAANVTIIQNLTLNNNPKKLLAGETVDAYVGDGLPVGDYRTAIESSNTLNGVTISNLVSVAIPEGATPDQIQTAINNTVASASAGDIIVIPNTDSGIKLPNVPSGVTLKGDGTTKVDASGALPNINGATLDGFVLECGQSSYHGFQHSDAVIKNCTIKGLLFSYNAGGEQVFENCTFINDKATGEYNMWAYGNVTYKNCKFQSYGKFVNVYNEGPEHFDVNFEGCTFVNLKDTSNKAGINVKDTSAKGQLDITVNVSDCTYEGAAPATQDTATLKVFNPVVQLDDINASGTSKVVIVQDGVTLWPKG